MKIYNVIYEWGEYSDKGWSLHGSFSSPELANNYITEQTTPVDPATKVEEYAAWQAKELIARKEWIQVDTKRIQERIAYLDKERPKFPHVPNWGKSAYTSILMEKLHNDANLKKSDSELLLEFWNFETWMRITYLRPEKDGFSIQETELDCP